MIVLENYEEIRYHSDIIKLQEYDQLLGCYSKWSLLNKSKSA